MRVIELLRLGGEAGLDGEFVRELGAGALLLAGVVLLVPRATDLVTRAAVPLAGWATRRQARLERFGLVGQGMIGALLGLVWSPCVGPTLGAATVLAAQGKSLGEVALVMAAFGFGIAAVLLLIATATRGFLSRWRGALTRTGHGGKRVLGALLALVALLILTGGDRLFEGLVVSMTPDWLTDLTTSL